MNTWGNLSAHSEADQVGKKGSAAQNQQQECDIVFKGMQASTLLRMPPPDVKSNCRATQKNTSSADSQQGKTFYGSQI